MQRTTDSDELAWLAAHDASQYPHPSVAVDVALFTVSGDSLRTLLVRRSEPPQAGRWALPGGFVGMDESLDAAAARVLAGKVGLEGVFTEQLYTFGAPDRDPRTRVIAVVYYALVDAAPLERVVAARGDVDRRLGTVITADAGRATVQDEGAADLELAFDHATILQVAVDRIRGKLDHAPIGFELLPPTFSLRDLRLVHEAIRGRPRNKDSFRRTVLDRGLVISTGERAVGLGHRPPELYRFARPAEGGDR